MSRYQFTSESVTEGHPDKLCDQVSDAILDAILAQDPKARVACETLAKTGIVTKRGKIELPQLGGRWADLQRGQYFFGQPDTFPPARLSMDRSNRTRL